MPSAREVVGSPGEEFASLHAGVATGAGEVPDGLGVQLRGAAAGPLVGADRRRECDGDSGGHRALRGQAEHARVVPEELCTGHRCGPRQVEGLSRRRGMHCRTGDPIDQVIDVDGGEDAPPARREDQSTTLGLLHRDQGPGPRPRAVDVARSHHRDRHFACGMGLERDGLGGDLGVDVGMPIGTQRPGFPNLVGESEIAVGTDRTQMDDAVDSGAGGRLHDASGPQDVDLPLGGGADGIADDRSGVDDDVAPAEVHFPGRRLGDVTRDDVAGGVGHLIHAPDRVASADEVRHQRTPDETVRPGDEDRRGLRQRDARRSGSTGRRSRRRRR